MTDRDLYGTPNIGDVYDSLSVYQSALETTRDYMRSVALEAAHKDQQRVERAIRGAIRAGYDGVDINHPDPMDGVGIVSIVPWTRPEPDGANGYQTERYTWDWFSEDELAAILAAENPREELDR